MRVFVLLPILLLSLLVILPTEGAKQKAKKLPKFLSKTKPKSTKKINTKDWPKILETLTPKVDDLNAVPIVQPPEAGQLSDLVQKQIVGGVDASLGQFPWQAFIYIDNAYLCGGSLILANWVMTAAHCAQGTNYVVVLGSINRSSYSTGYVTFTTITKFVHESYNPSMITSDIALLKSDQAITFTANISPVKLPPMTDGSTTFEGTLATVSGFGKISDTLGASNTLKFVDVTVISNQQCITYYGTGSVLNSNICTMHASKSTCSGDSGGPLVYKDNSNAWVQIGIVSYGAASGCLKGPSGYARVTSFLGWLSTKVGQDLSGTTTPSGTTVTSTSNSPSTTTTTTPTSTATSTTTSTLTTTATSTTTKTTTVTPTGTTGSTGSTASTGSTGSTGTTGISTTSTSSTKISTSTTTPKSTTTAEKTTKAPNCARANFDNLRKCCSLKPNDVVAFNRKDKTCSATNAAALEPFNKYEMNKQQNINIGNVINFNDTNIQRNIASDACFVDCYLKAKGVVSGGVMDMDKLMTFMASNQADPSWNKRIQAAAMECYSITKKQYINPISYNGKVCDVKGLIIAQCVQQRINMLCEVGTASAKCSADLSVFMQCARSIFI